MSLLRGRAARRPPTSPPSHPTTNASGTEKPTKSALKPQLLSVRFSSRAATRTDLMACFWSSGMRRVIVSPVSMMSSTIMMSRPASVFMSMPEMATLPVDDVPSYDLTRT